MPGPARRGSLRLVVDSLYRNALPDVSSEFLFDDEILRAALLRIYERRFNPLTQLDRSLFNEFWTRLNEATEKGIREVAAAIDPDDDFRDALRRNNGVFAAFKVHRMQNDMATMLLDENGNLKTFNQWMNDVKGIADHQCRRWFQTEYDTAVKRAHLAAQWRQFEREVDVLPNLEWVKTMSITPGEDHRPFWHPTSVILPMNDPFWNMHKPGDRWGCKCSLRSTDAPPTPLDRVPDGGSSDMPAPGLDNNPGKDGILFSDSHPYNPPNCSACRLPGKKVLLNNKVSGFFNLAKGRKDCYNCSRPQELIKKAEKLRKKREAFIEAKQEALEYLTQHFEPQMIESINFATGHLNYSKKGLKTLLNHTWNADEIKAALQIGNHAKSLKFIRVSPFGEGKDLVRDAKNLAKKKDLGIVQFNIYEYSYNAKTYYVKTAQYSDGFEMFYAFTKKP